MAATNPYGWEHQKKREALLRHHVEGTPCPFMDVDPKCTGPMYTDEGLDADHSTALIEGGTVADRLAHAACNRRAGQRIAIQRRMTPPPPLRTSRQW